MNAYAPGVDAPVIYQYCLTTFTWLSLQEMCSVWQIPTHPL